MSQTNVRCINCELRVTRFKRLLCNEDNALINIIRRWTYPRDISVTDYICQACWELANYQLTNANGQPEGQGRQVGHSNICVGCGRSILRTRSRLVLRPDCTDEERQLADVISQWIQPRQLTPTDQACLPCWLRARRTLCSRTTQSDEQRSTSLVSTDTDTCINCDNQLSPNEIMHRLSSEDENLVRIIRLWTYPREINYDDYICQSCWDLASHQLHEDELAPNEVTRPHTPQISQQQYIALPNIRRGADTRRNCLFPGCQNNERYRVPDAIRRRVLSELNFYIPRGARICIYHMGCNMFHELYTSENSFDNFNANHIEDMAFILSEKINFDFEDIQNMPEHLVHYWLGITKDQHQEILNDTQNLQQMHRGSFALTALLYKLRTGDSGDRLSSLFQTPRRTIEKLMDEAREILVRDYVPQHLGLQHISREDVVAKNSRIANGIFGNPELPIEERNAIVICDGTYVYTQKSSNYLFQKETYSLHKYRNLVKPFLIVCCNGYILDVVGPYSATTNDASIMSDLLRKDSFIDFFREDDVFILDRGFRDCVDELHDHGFQAHIPETLSPNETQLSTFEGNRSRCVTINRWVVEAINGRIKRDFKIFRQEYFNRASPHMMKDFSIAAALHNAFATEFTDPENAEAILSIIQDRLFLDNVLAGLVEQESLNRRNSLFHIITTTNVNFPHLSMAELVLFACGTYQIRQARSYIGEQFRFYGMYTIQVCTDEEIDLSRLGGIRTRLIRAKIKSRHISRKTYYVYIVIDEEQVGLNGYCCNCIVGLRTVGCCSHVMSIVWYLGYARHQANITPPAQFLDEVLLRLES